MIDILQHIQQYSPKSDDGKVYPKFLGGDQLTRVWASAGHEAKLQSSTVMGNLKGIIPKSEGWHTLGCLYQVW